MTIRLKSRLKPLAAVKRAAQQLKERHTARHTPSGFDFVLADSIDFIHPQDWDSLAQQTVFLSRDYLRVLERYSPDNLTCRYALAYAEIDGVRQPAAAILLQRIDFTGDRIRQKAAATQLRDKLRDKSLARYGEHLLVCGNVLIWGPRSIAFSPEFEPEALWSAVGEAVYRLRRADKLLGESDFVMIKDFAGGQQQVVDSLRLLGYRSVETEPDMALAIAPAWSKYDDYLASLTSSYRSSAKKLLKDCAAQGVSFRLLTPAEMLQRADELHALYLQVHEGQGLRLATLNSLYLPAMAQIMGERFRCRVAEKDGQALGFVTSVLDGDTTIGYYIGYDKASNANAPIYLSLLGSCVQDAIDFKTQLSAHVSKLSLGRTALEPKAKIGCKPEPISCAVKHRLSAINPLLGALTSQAQHAEPPERNPFKL